MARPARPEARRLTIDLVSYTVTAAQLVPLAPRESKYKLSWDDFSLAVTRRTDCVIFEHDSGDSPLRYRVGIAPKLQRFGGAQWFLTCPGMVEGKRCDRRVKTLYMPRYGFRCRQCCRLAYPSEHRNQVTRLEVQIRRMQQSLGIDTEGPFGPLSLATPLLQYSGRRRRGEPNISAGIQRHLDTQRQLVTLRNLQATYVHLTEGPLTLQEARTRRAFASAGLEWSWDRTRSN